MIREIHISNLKKGITNTMIEMAVHNNDDVLLSFCREKKPRFGRITEFGIEWDNWNSVFRDADETCHEFHQLLVLKTGNKIIAPGHAHEIYELHINPYTNKPLD